MATHIRLTVNDTVEFDGVVEDWKQVPPGMLQDMIKPGGQPRPWMIAAATVISTAVMSQTSTLVDVEHRSNRWTLKVEYP